MELSLFTFVTYVMHVHVHKMYQTTLLQALFSFALNSDSFLMFVFSVSRKPVSIMCDSTKNNASFIQRPNITTNSFGHYTLVFFITTTCLYQAQKLCPPSGRYTQV